MTPNKITKNDILEMYNEIEADRLLKKEMASKLMAFQGVVMNERECCIHNWYEGSETKPLTPRNMICFGNVSKAVIDNDFKVAWWELIDILTDVNDNEYLEIDELILFSLALDMIVEEIKKQNET